MDESELFDVPVLKCIFNKILKDEKPYCALCFRTNDETRLVTPNYFKMYLQATGIASRVQKDLICYICERKSKHALLLYRSAVFSNTIKLILEELVRRKIVEENVIFEMRHFWKILKSVGLSNKLTPDKIQTELQIIRNNSSLSETNMVVTDSTQMIQDKLNDAEMAVKLGVSSSTRIASIKFRKIGPNSSNQQENLSNESETVVIDDEEEQINDKSKNVTNNVTSVLKPTNLHLLTQFPNSDNATSGPPKIITMEDVQNQPNDQTNFILHDIFITDDNKYVVPSLGAEIIENTVTFYDSAKNIISTQPLAWSIDFLKNSSSNTPIFHQNDKPKKLTQKKKSRKNQCSKTSNLKMGEISIASIQNKNILLVSNTDSTQTNTLLVNTTDTCQEYPLAGATDNCDAIIVNSINTYENRELADTNTGDSILKSFLSSPPILPSVNALLYDTNNIAQNNIAAINAPDIILLDNQNTNCLKTVSDDSLMVTDNRKRKKTDLIISETLSTKGVLGNTSKITGVEITDICSDMDVTTSSQKSGTDWEDKIPMDVISFMDAVDPNADETFKATRNASPVTIRVSEPISLARGPPPLADHIDIIDLC